MDSIIVPSSVSCGVFQLFYLDNSYQRLMNRIYDFFIKPDRTDKEQFNRSANGEKDYLHPVWGKGAFIIFSDADLLGYGQAFADFLSKNKLAKITQSESAENPNSYNYITVYIAQLNHEKIAEWYETNKGK